MRCEDDRLKKCGLDGILDYCGKLGIESVPIEETDDSFSYLDGKVSNPSDFVWSMPNDKILEQLDKLATG